MMRVAIGAIALLLAAWQSPAANAAPGDLDASFGSGGIVTTDFGGRRDQASRIVLQPDGKILAVGSTNVLSGDSNYGAMDLALARYTANGTLDTSFGDGGRVTTHLPSSFFSMATDAAVQADGKIVVVGYSDSNIPATMLSYNSAFIVLRYLANGTLDTGFGSGGVRSVDIGPNYDVASSVLLQSDGRIVAAGTSYASYDYRSNASLALVRLNTDGSLDAGFGNAGIQTTTLQVPGTTSGATSVVTGLSQDSAGRIVAAGFAFSANYAESVPVLARYTTAGVLDAGFGNAGIVQAGFTANQYTGQTNVALALQADGKIVTAGRAPGLLNHFHVQRYNSDGSRDSTFGSAGSVQVGFDGVDADAYALAIDAQGNIVVGGQAGGYGFLTISGVSLQIDSGAPAASLALARLTPTGALDASFGTGGKVTTRLPGDSGTGSMIASLRVVSDGIVVGGVARNDVHAMSTFSSNDDMFVAKYASGASTSTFNPDQHGLTGAWYNPATSGQGLLVETYPDLGGAGQGYLAAGWYTFDVTAAGGQRWYSLQGPANAGSASIALDIFATTGGNFAAAPKASPTKVGSATLTFADCANASLAYTFTDGRSGTFPLARADANITCAPAGDSAATPGHYLLSGAWYDAATSGQGLFFVVNPAQSLLFAGWYTFSPAGATAGAAGQRWYTIQDNAFAAGMSSKSGLAIYETTGGVFNSGKVGAGAPVGTATVTFSSCTALSISYAFTAGTNAGKSGSLSLSRVVRAPANCVL